MQEGESIILVVSGHAVLVRIIPVGACIVVHFKVRNRSLYPTPNISHVKVLTFHGRVVVVVVAVRWRGGTAVKGRAKGIPLENAYYCDHI